VARQNKPTPKTKHVITNDEIPSMPQADSPRANSTEADASNGSAQSERKDNDSDKSKHSTSKTSKERNSVNVPGLLDDGTLDQAKALLDSLKHDRQALIDNYDKIQRKLADEQDDSLRRVYSDSLARRDETLAKNQKQIDDTEKAIQIAVQARGEQGDNQHEAQ
jgi:hypothetical protein